MPSLSSVSASFVAALLLVGTGCTRYVYRVDLKPVAAGLERTVVRSGAQVPAAADSVEPVTVVTFAGPTPVDIGGAGNYTEYATSLGTAHVYAERFRGNDDLVGQWERQSAAIDAVVDLLLTWIDARFGDEPGADRLRGFTDTAFRRDLKNAAAYAWFGIAMAQASEAGPFGNKGLPANGELAIEESIGRLILYLVERGYVAPSDVPALSRDVEGEGNGRVVMELIRRQLAVRMDRGPRDAAPLFADVTDWEALVAAFRAHICDSATARRRLLEWARAANAVRDPEAWDSQLSELQLAALHLPLYIPNDQLVLRLMCGERPVSTNGAWDETTGSVRWNESMEVDPSAAAGLPLFAYAVWATPDAPAQRAHFGGVLLTGENLAKYCLWRSALSPEEAAQWDSLLSRIKPDHASAAARLREFRFSGQRDAKEAPRGAQLLLRLVAPR